MTYAITPNQASVLSDIVAKSDFIDDTYYNGKVIGLLNRFDDNFTVIGFQERNEFGPLICVTENGHKLMYQIYSEMRKISNRERNGIVRHGVTFSEIDSPKYKNALPVFHLWYAIKDTDSDRSKARDMFILAISTVYTEYTERKVTMSNLLSETNKYK